MKQTTVWIDHHKAFIFQYLADGIHEKTLESHHKGKISHEELNKFYHELAHKIEGAESILILGPGQAKEEFKNHCEDHHPSVNKAIVKVDSMKDHPTPNEILKISNAFFKSQNSWKGI